jgi:AGZA family xanthine/uracil permease-like MFS transporter
MLGATAAFIIDRKFNWAAIYALGASVLAYFGVINGTALGFGNSSSVALGYLLVALICLGLARQGLYAPIEAPEDAVAEPGD